LPRWAHAIRPRGDSHNRPPRAMNRRGPPSRDDRGEPGTTSGVSTLSAAMEEAAQLRLGIAAAAEGNMLALAATDLHGR
jgi:hypothetical protein